MSRKWIVNIAKWKAGSCGMVHSSATILGVEMTELMVGRVVRDGTFLGDDTRDGNDRVKVGRTVWIGHYPTAILGMKMTKLGFVIE